MIIMYNNTCRLIPARLVERRGAAEQGRDVRLEDRQGAAARPLARRPALEVVRGRRAGHTSSVTSRPLNKTRRFEPRSSKTILEASGGHSPLKMPSADRSGATTVSWPA